MASGYVADEAVTLFELEWTIAWNVRGDPSRSRFASETSRLLGVALPLEPNTTTRRSGTTLLWLGPRSWLLVADRDAVGHDFDASRAMLNAADGALFDLSAAYVGWKVSGPDAPRILNRSCPLDFHPKVFLAGACAQSVLDHINALYYRPSEANAFCVVVARSLAPDAWHTLCESAKTDGFRIGSTERFNVG
jgi:sarcosine oxidase subunit gamma